MAYMNHTVPLKCFILRTVQLI